MDRAMRFVELDRAVGEEIRAEMEAEGSVVYPAVCSTCMGTGNNGEGQPCPDCDGRGWYELAAW